ncbi:MAG: acetate/propionate family kinase [Alphaproteobacteria bacterium]|nr:acetate/propionate family kinase [Alphaproteobacteria bacterium]MCB9793387.1 acetate/propionate family kinase [Alphaproteobacteria bacterium]
MYVLVVNAGSTSLKLDLLDPDSGARAGVAKAQRVGTEGCVLSINGDSRPLPGADHAAALREALPLLAEGGEILAVGHRMVHGGEQFTRSVAITDEVIAAISALTWLAPLHVPANLAGLAAAREALPGALHVAVFDTAFHATLPRRAQVYALPRKLSEAHGLRRYGFHGTSHQIVAERVAAWLGEDLRDLRIITCHLGGGCSVAAVEYGRSVETSMGMTPLEGLVMGTRSGDIDPGLLLELGRREGLDLDGLDALLNRESGLAGLSGRGADMRDIERGAAEGDEGCRLAIQVFTHRLRKYIGAYAAVMGGVDAIAFTAGIGENSALIRHRVAQRLDFLGARLDEDRNRDAKVGHDAPVAEISEHRSRARLLVVATDEALAIAHAAAGIYREAYKVEEKLNIPIAVSARHVHLTREAVDALFGEGHQLTPYKPLSQPGQFACEEKVDLIGPKRSIQGVRVLGPERSACQVEVSRTDEFFLGLDAPVRGSGDVKNSPGIKLVGPAGELTIHEGVICAWRHIHMTPEDAERFGVKDRDVVEVAVNTQERNLIFGDVLVRVSSKYALEMHIDTDEANAAEITGHVEGALVDTGNHATLRRRKL